MLVEGIDISERDYINMVLTNKEVFGTWVVIVSGFLLLKSASDNRIITKNRYTKEFPEDQLPDPLDPAILSLLLGAFTAIWFTYTVIERYQEVKRFNEELDAESQQDLWPSIAIVIGTLIGIIGIAFRFQAALQKKSEEVAKIPTVFIA